MANSEFVWTPIKSQDGASQDDDFGSYVQYNGTWASRWRKGDCEMEIMGYGAIPSDTQRATWRLLKHDLDKLLNVALDSLPPPPRRHWIAALFRKQVSIDGSHPMLELCDDGSHVMQFRSDLVIEGHEFGPWIEMQGTRVLCAEWSC